MILSVLHATRGRTQQALKVREDWFAKATDPGRVEYFFSVDSDDPDLVSFSKVSDDYSVKIIVGPSQGCNAPFNRAARNATGDVFLIAADDLVPPQDWDQIVLDRLKGTVMLPRVLAVSDGHRKDKLITHPILTRARWEQQGKRVFDPIYPSVWADSDFTECAYRDGVVIEAKDVTFEHSHPAFGCRPWDQRYQKQNGAVNATKGEAIFRKRFPKSLFLSNPLGQ